MTLKISIIISIILLLPANGICRDHMIRLFEEHYREKMIIGGGETKIYHSWQVETRYGNKLLVLVGNDRGYRTWLRRFEKKHKLFIVKIPKEGEDKFKSDRVVLVNIQQIHGVNGKRWKCSECRGGPPPGLSPTPGTAPIVLPGAPGIVVR